MKSADIRQSFLDYFARNGHEVVTSSPLVPGNDPTLLFTNAGMVQFKDVFLGVDQRPYQRAVSSQRCVRAGGKHNDLENVGYTARHHTFFEMLGNFSFGDYFKEQAIRYAWEYLTDELGLAAERLWVTVYEDDDEAADIWLNTMGVSQQRFSRLGKKDNFWAMGDTGPCGPCSEIFYDHGPDIPGGPPGSPDEDGDRYVEIWNLVFMQYDAAADGTVNNLPQPSVDTGMGLERIAAVMQGVHNNYEIDLFVNLVEAAASIANQADKTHASLRVIADHIRACAFLITDGVLPSNEGRGYVLRRIIRRAIRHGYKLGIKDSFFYQLVSPLNAEMGTAYPELSRNQAHVEKILRTEEQRFAETLEQGMGILEAEIAAASNKVIAGDVAFKLYDTYGFPVDLTADIARERGMSVDDAGFAEAMEAQKERGRAASKFGADLRSGIKVDQVSQFTGYETLQTSSAVDSLICGGVVAKELSHGDEGIVFLAKTPFYAESGGQVGDVGQLRSDAGVFAVTDTQKFGQGIGHIGRVSEGAFKPGDVVVATVDAATRAATVLNHTATHLMHAALRTVLGDHVTQKGSLVAPDRLRFDFSHYEPVSRDELERVEAMVNQQIRNNAPAETQLMAFDDAIEAGAMALFGEKYDSDVRVLRVGDFSMELCGGTHVDRAGDIGLFKIVSEGGVASGVRRIEAVTGDAALQWVRDTEEQLQSVAALVKSGRDEVRHKVEALFERSRAMEKEIARLKKELVTGKAGPDLMAQVREAGGIKVLAARQDGLDAGALRDSVDQFKDRLGKAVVVLGSVDDGKVRLVVGVSKDCVGKVKAGELIGEIAAMVGGRGGGRPDMAQAGGNDPSQLDHALASVYERVQKCL
ncbi:MAG: alanine--tRNA ligase [Gammaproteobacteria bacterium]|nr:alanine--tRNA ligase [Gammaproteobacteria bacterium]